MNNLASSIQLVVAFGVNEEDGCPYASLSLKTVAWERHVSTIEMQRDPAVDINVETARIEEAVDAFNRWACLCGVLGLSDCFTEDYL